VGKTKFHKSHTFDFRGPVPILDGSKPGIGGKLLPGQSPKKNCSVYPTGVGGGQPAWVAFDRKVLRFYGYFQEAVHERTEEQFRVRRCTIYFYLEDDTIQVNEPQQVNSGIPQGTLIRRHRISLPAPDDDLFYTVKDFNIGQKLTLYGRVFSIVDCDEFTRNFLRKLGVRVPASLDCPSDPYTTLRDQQLESMQPLRPYEKLDTFQQFLDYDRHVLRFFCRWDDSPSMFGDVRWLVLHYFLADDTVEVLEKIPANSGRDAVPVFLRRARLPKEAVPMDKPGVATKRTVLNVFGSGGHGGRYILDSLKTGAVATDYFRDSDLTVGGMVNLWGRRLLLCDCDELTKEYYRSKYGVERFEAVDVSEPPLPPQQRQVPPYNGFGSQEDSLASHLNLIPKPPRRDFKKFMEKDRHGLDSNVLRFVARMDTSRPIDVDRRFTVFFHLSDDTITIFEPPQRNSGIIGGKFMERGRIAKPRESAGGDEGSPSQYYLSGDLWVGAQVDFNSHRFVLIDCDEYALRYMEAHPAQFPHADKDAVLKKVSARAKEHIPSLQAAFREQDPSNSGSISVQQFTMLVKRLSQGLLSDHECLTLGRAFGQRAYPILPALVRLVQDDLHKHNFTQFAALETALAQCCQDETGFIDPAHLRRVCEAAEFPLSHQLVDATLMNCQISSSGAVDYQQFLQLINWRDHPLPTPRNTVAAGQSGSWTSGQSQTISAVDYTAFLSALQT
jgi:Ca2+-binding EF-hand superfamily protein